MPNNHAALSRAVAEALEMAGRHLRWCKCGFADYMHTEGAICRQFIFDGEEMQYPDLTTCEGFGLLLAAMRAKGWWWEGCSSLGAYLATFYDGRHRREEAGQ